MKTYTITLENYQEKALQQSSADIQEWLQNWANFNATRTVNEIVSSATLKYLEEGIAIPSTKEEIIDDVFARGWRKTAQQLLDEAAARNGTSE